MPNSPSNGPRGAADAKGIPATTRPFVDYSSQMRITANGALRLAFRLLGLFFLGLGVLGYILPGLPGTVFILISAYFFAQSSPRFYNWLMNHRVFGVWIRDFRAGKGVPLWVKIYAPVMMVLFSGFSIYLFAFVQGRIWLAAIVAALVAYGIWYILRLPTKQPGPKQQ